MTQNNTEDLTQREKEVMELIVPGLMNKEIAAELCISEATVENHLLAIYRKLGVRNRTEASYYVNNSLW